MTQQLNNPTGWLSAMMARWGIQRFGPWSTSEAVSNVAIVDSFATINVTNVLAALGTPSSAGELAAPVANTRLADTGALSAGPWTFYILLSSNDGNHVRMRHRNAADAADIESMRIVVNTNLTQIQFRRTMALNERLVVEMALNATAGTLWQCQIYAVAG